MRILVAGGTGTAGQHIVRMLEARGGHRIEVLNRESGDATDPAVADRCCQGQDAVVSALGQSVYLDRARPSPFSDIDVAAHRNLITACQRHGTRRFVYISVLYAARHPDDPYLAAHSAVEAMLRQSGIPYGIVRPTGFFKSYLPFLDLAFKGTGIVLGSGAAKSNPVHEADVAEACVKALFEERNVEIDAGGPAIHTRRQIAELAFEAIGKKPLIFHAPLGLVRMGARLARLFDSRKSELFRFACTVSEHDFVGPAIGTRSLLDYFREAAKGRVDRRYSIASRYK